MTASDTIQDLQPIGDSIPAGAVQYFSQALAGIQPKTGFIEAGKEPWKSIINAVCKIPLKETARRLKAFQAQIEQHGGNYQKISAQILKIDPSKPAPVERKTEWSCGELLQSSFPPPTYIIEGFIPAAKVTLIASKPKRKKSFMALQIAVAIAKGLPMFGPDGKATKKGKVIYFVLEDPPGRVKKRLQCMGVNEDLDIIFIFRGDFPPIDKGGDVFLKKLIEKEKPDLIIIDTISKIYSGRFDENKAECCLAIFPKIRAIADDTGTAFLLIHHHKKGFSCSGDPRDDARGSSAIAGDVDIIGGIYFENSHNILRMVGNDLEEDIEWAIEFDTKVPLGWSIIGKAEDVAMSQTELDIIEKLREVEKSDLSQLARALKKKEPTVRKALKQLMREGKVSADKDSTKTGSKKYVYSLEHLHEGREGERE